VLLVPDQRAVGLLLEHAHDAVALARAVGRFHDDAVRAVPIEITAFVRGLNAIAPRLPDLRARQESGKRVARKVDRRPVRAGVLTDHSRSIESGVEPAQSL